MSGTYGDEGGLDPRGAASCWSGPDGRRSATWTSGRRGCRCSRRRRVGRLRCGVAVGPRTASLQGPDRRGSGGPVCRRADPDRQRGLRSSPRQRGRQGELGAPAPRGGSGPGGGIGRRVRLDGSTGGRRGERRIVYGVYVGTATLIVLGAFGAARAAVREDWPGLGLSIAIVLVAAGSAFAGPRGVWASDGVGLCVALLGYSAAQAWLLRASRSDA